MQFQSSSNLSKYVCSSTPRCSSHVPTELSESQVWPAGDQLISTLASYLYACMLSPALRTLVPPLRSCFLLETRGRQQLARLATSSLKLKLHSRVYSHQVHCVHHRAPYSYARLEYTKRTMSTAPAKDVPAEPAAPTPGPPKDQELPKMNFPVSPMPENPLGEGQYIKTAAALIIGYVCVLLRMLW